MSSLSVKLDKVDFKRDIYQQFFLCKKSLDSGCQDYVVVNHKCQTTEGAACCDCASVRAYV